MVGWPVPWKAAQSRVVTSDVFGPNRVRFDVRTSGRRVRTAGRSVRWVNCDLLYPLPFLPCGRLSGQRSGRPGARPSGRLDGRSLWADGLADGGTDDRAGGRHADN